MSSSYCSTAICCFLNYFLSYFVLRHLWFFCGESILVVLIKSNFSWLLSGYVKWYICRLATAPGEWRWWRQESAIRHTYGIWRAANAESAKRTGSSSVWGRNTRASARLVSFIWRILNWTKYWRKSCGWTRGLRFSGMNFQDLMVRQGAVDNPPKTPFTLGFECAGEIEMLGDNVQGFQVRQKKKYWCHVMKLILLSKHELSSGGWSRNCHYWILCLGWSGRRSNQILLQNADRWSFLLHYMYIEACGNFRRSKKIYFSQQECLLTTAPRFSWTTSLLTSCCLTLVTCVPDTAFSCTRSAVEWWDTNTTNTDGE